MSGRHLCVAMGAVLLSIGFAPHSAVGQVSVQVGPYAGIYAPTASFGSAPLPSPFAIPSTSRQSTALIVGAQATLWLDSRIGLSAQWGTASSTIRTRGEIGGQEAKQSARVSAGALQLLVPLQGPSLQRRVYISGGIGLMRRGGDFFDAYEQPSNVTGVLGVGSQFALGRRAQVLLGFDTYLYSLRLREPGGATFDSGFQGDLLARAGIMLDLAL
jgi:hypothetical protein